MTQTMDNLTKMYEGTYKKASAIGEGEERGVE